MTDKERAQLRSAVIGVWDAIEGNGDLVQNSIHLANLVTTLVVDVEQNASHGPLPGVRMRSRLAAAPVEDDSETLAKEDRRNARYL
jgi:hypothetical protein